MLIATWVYWLLVAVIGLETVVNLVQLGREKIATEKKTPRVTAAISLVLELVILYGLIV